jgi:hypothetical protein
MCFTADSPLKAGGDVTKTIPTAKKRFFFGLIVTIWQIFPIIAT